MATTVRVDDETRGWLERLRAELTLATGRRLSLEETLHLITQRAVERKDVLLPEIDDTPLPPDDPAWDRIFALPKAWGTFVRPEDIDLIVTEDTRREEAGG